jgi:UDP-N-acetylmuramoylalanine--D-glutamate ligase
MNVIVWGLGISGLSALKYLSKKNTDNIYIVNQGDVSTWGQLDAVLELVSKANCYSQNAISSDLEVDQIILSPGVPRYLEELKPYLERGVEVISDIELAYRGMGDVPIVAITGTNGKTTTTTMISQALELAGYKVFTGGNIGVAACDYFLDSNYNFIILELSSFQLESLKDFHANIAIILNITENHMERYSKLDDYKNAKLNIVMNQNNTDHFIAPQELLSETTAASKVEICSIEGYSFEKSKILGKHNYENFFCVESVLKNLGVSNYKVFVQNLIDSFRGVEFRLQYIKTANDIDFYNDAKSTNTASTVAAIKSFKGKQLCLILGGKLRDLNGAMGHEFKKEKINIIYAFGESASLILKELGDNYNVKVFETLKEIVTSDNLNSFEGSVLFSPGFPSFDQYRNYIERGRDFNQLVELL